jgi:L-gulono-1,4-lactone dehydrogenase
MWRNWGRSESVTPVEIARPRSTDEIVAIVAAARDRGLRVKPVGTGHSFSGVALAPGIQLDMSGMTGLLGVDGNAVTLGAGTRLHDLPPLLDPHGLALENMGDIDVQTVSGATSTGTHGTGARFGGLATRVSGATLVTGDGTVLTVDAENNAELLPAVALGLGALGVLTQITVECVPSFALHVVERPEPLAQVLEEWPDRIAGADHFEFYWFAHTSVGLTKTSTRLAADVSLKPIAPLSRWIEDRLMSNTVYGWSTNLQRAFPRSTPAFNRFSTHHWGDREFTDISHRSFATPRTLRFVEMEYALPQLEVPDVLREIDALIESRNWTVSFPIEVRAAAADDLWISTASGRATGYIAVHRQFHEDPTAYFRGVEEIMKAHDGRPHWGKMNTRTAADLAPAYPRFTDFLKVRDRLDPDRMFGNDYLDRVLGP